MAQPVANGANRAGRIISVIADVLPADVRQIRLVAVTLAVKNEATLVPLLGSAVTLRAEEHAQFQRHVKTRQLRRPTYLGSRNIVDAESTIPNDVVQLGDADRATVFLLQRVSGH